MPNDKAPGCDGLPAKIYKVCWDQIKNPLFDIYMQALNEGKLCRTARRGLISLLPKGNKDPAFLKNWRPLTLLNMDYKILAKLLALRLKKVMPTLIGEQQTGFMQERIIAENIKKTIGVLTYVNNQNSLKRYVIMTIDLKSASTSLHIKQYSAQ